MLSFRNIMTKTLVLRSHQYTQSNQNLVYLLSSMSSTPTHYTNLYPKRGDISGSNNQAVGKGEDMISHVIGGIKAKTIAAIGTIALGSSLSNTYMPLRSTTTWEVSQN